MMAMPAAARVAMAIHPRGRGGARCLGARYATKGDLDGRLLAIANDNDIQ